MAKHILINSDILEKRVTVVDGSELEEYFVEQQGTTQLYGNIYKGVVQSIVPGIAASFVNLGLEKNGFLYVSDVLDKNYVVDDDIEFEDKVPKRNVKIGDLLKVGQEIIVQIGKEPIGTKGARLTTNISIPGRFLVLTPFSEGIGISRRISDRNERSRIKKIITDLRLPKGVGCIVRTAAKGSTDRQFKREISYLLNLWKRINFRARKSKAPSVLYEEYDLILRIVRDRFTDDIEKLYVDSREGYKAIIRFLKYFMPSLRQKVFFYNSKTPLFRKFNVEREIEKLFYRKISLKNGGSIFIEQTEGMVAIDVNTEKFTGRKNIEDTIFRTNKEAAKEIAKQIRLRDMGGIIVIDFIDMRQYGHRKKIQEILQENLKKDKAKSNILNISSIGVIEMTRQRMRRSLESKIYKKCPHCNGKGLLKSTVTVAMQILREIESACLNNKKRLIKVYLNPAIHDFILTHEKKILYPLTKRCRKSISIYPDDNIAYEDVRLD